MTPRSRLIAFGSAALVVLAGVLSAVLVSGLIGQLLTLVLVSVGLGGAVLLLFLEVGLSEDRERERAAARRAKRAPAHESERRLRSRRLPRRRS